MDTSNIEISNGEYDKIKAIKTSVGGHFGGSYEVHIDLENRNLVWKHSLRTYAELYEETIDEDTLVKFIDGLKTLKVLEWKAKYINSQASNGKSWSVEITKDDEVIEKQGIDEFSDQWFEFCSLIKEISGKDFQ